jgi:hypothetical protein
MMRRFDVAVAVCFAVMIWSAVAHAETGGVSMMGAGRVSCGRFIASIGKHPPGGVTKMSTHDGDLVSENAEYLQWLEGFVSGYNAVVSHIGQEEQQVKQVDTAGLDLWMRNWCNKHPTQLVGEAAQLFINEMLKNEAARR